MKSKLTCIVVDDCELDRKAVEAEILLRPDLHLLGSFNNCLEALSLIENSKPDVLFMDIDMPEINGLEFIKGINNSDSTNIIISSHPEYALESFQLKVFDYILKPLEHARFDKAVERLKDFSQLKSKAKAYDVLFERECVIFKDGLVTVKVNASDIVYLEAFGDYTKIVTKNKIHLTLTTLSNFLESLPEGKFIRIHRSYIIAKDKINFLSTKSVEVEANLLPIGKTYLKTVKHCLKN